MVIPFRAAAAPAADEATLLRVFLTDGTSLVSYGEPARVSDRVIFSMPTATTPNPPLHLVNLPIARVDWDRTSRYAATARASHYVETQAETDYAALSNDVAPTLNEVALTAEPSQRLAIVQRARQTLADWPQTHFNYRAAEVRQMLGMLDEAIADLQASRTPGPLRARPCRRSPIRRRSSSRCCRRRDAARGDRAGADGGARGGHERRAHVAAGDRGRRRSIATRPSLPAEWAAATRADAQPRSPGSSALDRSYQSLTARMMALANRRAQQADVRGVERVRARDSAARRGARRQAAGRRQRR